MTGLSFRCFHCWEDPFVAGGVWGERNAMKSLSRRRGAVYGMDAAIWQGQNGRYSRVLMICALRWARAMMLIIGLTPVAVGRALASATKRFWTS